MSNISRLVSIFYLRYANHFLNPGDAPHSIIDRDGYIFFFAIRNAISRLVRRSDNILVLALLRDGLSKTQFSLGTHRSLRIPIVRATQKPLENSGH